MIETFTRAGWRVIDALGEGFEREPGIVVRGPSLQMMHTVTNTLNDHRIRAREGGEWAATELHVGPTRGIPQPRIQNRVYRQERVLSDEATTALVQLLRGSPVTVRLSIADTGEAQKLGDAIQTAAVRAGRRVQRGKQSDLLYGLAVRCPDPHLSRQIVAVLAASEIEARIEVVPGLRDIEIRIGR